MTGVWEIPEIGPHLGGTVGVCRRGPGGSGQVLVVVRVDCLADVPENHNKMCRHSIVSQSGLDILHLCSLCALRNHLAVFFTNRNTQSVKRQRRLFAAVVENCCLTTVSRTAVQG